MSIFTKSKIVFKKFSAAVNHWFYDFCEEVFVIFRNQSYARNHPALFALFSIVQQEQNTQIFDLQRESFDKIRRDILKSDSVINHHILEALRGIFHNNNYIKFTSNDVKDKLVKYLFQKSRRLIDENDAYYAPLVKIVICAFPFLLNYDKYTIFRKLVKRKSRNSLKLLKYIFDNYQAFDFIKNEEDILGLISVTIAFDNKPAFMMIVRFLRKSGKLSMIYQRKAASLRRKIFDIKSTDKRGFDYVAIALSYCDNLYLKEEGGNFFDSFLNSALSQEIKEKERLRRYQKINLYLDLGKRAGCQNSITFRSVKDLVDRNIIKKEQKFRINRLKKIKKNLSKTKRSPGSKVQIRAIFNLTKQHPEEYWMMEFSPYLL